MWIMVELRVVRRGRGVISDTGKKKVFRCSPNQKLLIFLLKTLNSEPLTLDFISFDAFIKKKIPFQNIRNSEGPRHKLC